MEPSNDEVTDLPSRCAGDPGLAGDFVRLFQKALTNAICFEIQHDVGVECRGRQYGSDHARVVELPPVHPVSLGEAPINLCPMLWVVHSHDLNEAEEAVRVRAPSRLVEREA